MYPLAKQLGAYQLFTWGTSDWADLKLVNEWQEDGNLVLVLQERGKPASWEISLPFTDKASKENAMNCVATLCCLGYTSEEIQHKLGRLNNLPMRLELKKGMNQCLLINDAYNNDLAGLSIALDFMARQDDAKSRTVILSDVLEAQSEEEKLYASINLLLASKGIQKFIGVGERISQYAQLFEQTETYFYKDVASYLADPPVYHNETVLIKGARNYQLEQLVGQLEEKAHGTRLEVNLEALQHNLNFYRSLLKPTTKIMVMVKAFAYGSGSFEVARLLQYHRVDYLAVAYTDEGRGAEREGNTIAHHGNESVGGIFPEAD